MKQRNYAKVDGLMTVRLQDGKNPFGVVKTDENSLVELKACYRIGQCRVYVLGRTLALLRKHLL